MRWTRYMPESCIAASCPGRVSVRDYYRALGQDKGILERILPERNRNLQIARIARATPAKGAWRPRALFDLGREPEPVRGVEGDRERDAAEDNRPVVPVAASGLLVDRHGAGATPRSISRITPSVHGSSLTPAGARVAFSPSDDDSMVSIVHPILCSVETRSADRS